MDLAERPSPIFAGMKADLFLLSLSLVLLFSYCAAPSPQEASIDPVPDPAITTEAGSDAATPLTPGRYAKDWLLPSLDRWETHWQEQYKADSTGDLRMRHADMDGDGTIDHALFLCRADTTRRDTSYAVVVSFGNGRDTLLETYPWAEYQGGIGMGLALEPPGTLSHLGGEEDEAEASTVRLKHPAVTVIFFEKASITWFWDKGTFQQVWTGD